MCCKQVVTTVVTTVVTNVVTNVDGVRRWGVIRGSWVKVAY